jgi:hypothetical protein
MEESMKKTVFAVLAMGFLGGLVFAQTPNDFKIDFTEEGDGLIIAGYTGTDTMVVVPAEIEGILVRGISLNAFHGNRNITEIVFPDGVTEIPDGMFTYSGGAFRGCSKLTSVTLPRGLTKIGAGAFAGCTSLTTITMPNTVTEIREGAFSGCSSLVSIIIPNGVTRIGDSAFSSCSSLTSIIIPSSVTQIGGSAFRGCSGLTSITIPSSVIQIGESAFRGCSGLTAIALPIGVKAIGLDAFLDCKNLTTVNLEEGAAIKFDLTYGSVSRSFLGCDKLDVKSQIALKRAGYGGSF